MNGSTRERLARKQLGKAQQKPGALATPPDPLHNLDSPCCLLIQEAALDILPESSREANRDMEQSVLGRIVKQHLQNGVSATSTPYVASNSAKKKKKRRKKKKGGNTTATEGMVEGAEEGTDTASEPSPFQGADTESGTQPPPPPDAALIQTPPPPSSSSASSTPNLLQKWLQQASVDDSSAVKNRDFSSFLEHISEQPVLVDYAAAREAVNAIACPACKQVVESYFRAHCEPGYSIALAVSNMETETRSGLQIPGMAESVENAFDYFAMEEGIEQQSDALLTLRHVDSFLKSSSPVSLEHVESIMRDLILSHGLVEQQDENDPMDEAYDPEISDVMDDTFNRIIDQVKQEEENVVGLFRNLELNHATLRAQIDEVDFSYHFDIKTKSIFDDSDKMFDETFIKLLQLVRDLARMHYRSSFRQTPEMVKDVDEMYDCVIEAVETMVHAQLAHVARIVQLADRPGSVPQLALNVEHRRSFQAMLISKVTALRKLRHGLRSILLDRLLCRRIWTHVHLDGLYFPNKDSEKDGFERFWETCVEMIKTTPGVKASDLKTKQFENARDWMNAIVTTQQRLPSRQTIPAQHEERYKQLLLEARAQCLLLESERNRREDEIPQFANVTCLLFQNVVRQTFHTRRATEIIKYDGTVHITPKMKLFMKGQEISRRSRTGPCEGGGGSRRTTGILVGLFYRWLNDRCNEWNAELTQKELIESMTDEPAEEHKGPKSKKSKKKRNKEKKNAISAATTGSEEIDRSSGEVPIAAESIDVPNDHKDTRTVTTAYLGVSNGSGAGPPDLTSSPNYLKEESNEKNDVSINETTRDLDSADTWAEWRADLTDTGLLDNESSPIKMAEEEFKVAESKKTKKKRGKEKQTVSDFASSSEPVKSPIQVPVSSKVASNITDSRSSASDRRHGDEGIKSATNNTLDTRTERRNISMDKSKENLEHSKQKPRMTKPDLRIAKKNSSPKPAQNIPQPYTTERNIAKESKDNKSSPHKSQSGSREKAIDKTQSQDIKAATQVPGNDAALDDSGEGHAREVTPEPDVDTEKVPEIPKLKVLSCIAPPVEVGVVSSTGFQSAEGFLVQRLEKAMLMKVERK